MSAPGEKSETQVMRGEITESERRSSTFTVLCESVGTWHVQTYNRTLESSGYLNTHRRRLQEYRRQQPTSLIDIFADSDWASDKTDRKSESCVVKLIGEHCIRCQTATQSATALSSGDAEHVGNVKSGSFGIGMHPMARYFGDEQVVQIATDSGASKGITSRLELGKIRHLDTGLWLLQRLKTPESEKNSRRGHQRRRRKRHEANHDQNWLPRTSNNLRQVFLYDEDHGTIV